MQPDDSVTLQVNGVPVLVNPESELMTDEMAGARLNPCFDVNGKPKVCEVGPDDVVILQVNGVPILVNPESELMTNQMADARLNPCFDVNGKPKICEVGPDEVVVAQLDNFEPTFDDSVVLQVNGVPVLVNPESELMKNEMADARLQGVGERKWEVGPDNITAFAQQIRPAEYQTLLIDGKPVLVNMADGPRENAVLQLTNGDIMRVMY